MKKMKRKDAYVLGIVRYWSGQPCQRGHHSERYTRSGSCIECTRFFSNGRNGSTLVSFKLAAHSDDVKLIRDFAYSLARARRLDHWLKRND